MTKLDSILKSRDITLPTKVHLVKAMVSPVVIYGCDIWNVKEAEHQRIDAFELWCWRRLWRIPWTARRSNQSIVKEIGPGCSLEGLMLKLKLQYFGHLMWRVGSLERLWCWEELGAGRKGEHRGWDGWMASPTQWTYEFEWTPGVGDGHGGLACCDSWGCKESDTTERLNWTERSSEIEITDQQDPAVVQLLGWVKWKRCYLTIFLMFGSGTASAWTWNWMRVGAWRISIAVSRWTHLQPQSPVLELSQVHKECVQWRPCPRTRGRLQHMGSLKQRLLLEEWVAASKERNIGFKKQNWAYMVERGLHD